MDKDKIELLLRLHKEGKITTEEAIILMPSGVQYPVIVEPLRVSDWPWTPFPQITYSA